MDNNENMKYLLFFLIWADLGLLWASGTIGKFSYEKFGEPCEVQYNLKKYSRLQMENASYLAFKLISLEMLESCNQSLDSRYKDCGEWKATGSNFWEPNFLHNAKVNLDINDTLISTISAKEVPFEFEKIKLQFLKDLQFEQQLYKTKYQYFNTRDPKILENASIAGLDLKTCLVHLKNLTPSTPGKTIEEMVSYKWHTCVNGLYKRLDRKLAEAAWEKLIISEVCEEPWP